MSSTNTDAPVLPEQFGPYRIVRPLGRGGMGAVYLARDSRLDRDVALKVCTVADNPVAVERFRREAKAAAGLSHTNLCPVYEFDVRDGIAYLTMAFVEGPTLNKWVAQRGRLSQRDAVRLTAKLAVGMQTAHDAGIIHRDLKPTNVVINKKNEPIILDFGLARQMDDEGPRLTQVGAIYGTPAYMAPEQASGDPTLIGPACDIYSLGVILYELLTGRVPFEGSFTAMMAQLMAAPPQPLRTHNPAVDPQLEALCLKTLAKAPKDRPPSMKEFARSLAKIAPTLAAAAVVSDPPTLATRSGAATSPDTPVKASPARSQPTKKKGEEVIVLPLAAPDDIVDLPLTEPPSRLPPPLPPRPSTVTHRQGPRHKPAGTSGAAWIICGISAAIILIAVIVTFIIAQKRDDTSDSGSAKDDSPNPITVAANRTKSQNNLKQIGLALHSYHSAWGRFPPAVIRDGTGQALYSWRVAILPYLEQNVLYGQWKLDEPWNSPNNQRLWSQTPPCYRLPGKEGDSTQTYYQVFTSDPTALEAPGGGFTAFGAPGGTRLTDFVDGTSNSILVIEAAQPVPWYEPRDIPFTSKPSGLDPSLFGGHFGKGVNVVLGDGSVRVVPFSMPPLDFQNAVTINEGTVFDWPK